jgi:hypothetical protein
VLEGGVREGINLPRVDTEFEKLRKVNVGMDARGSLDMKAMMTFWGVCRVNASSVMN